VHFINDLRPPFNDQNALLSQLLHSPSLAHHDSEIILYHACQLSRSRDRGRILASLASLGPDIIYARPKGYFSNQPAVYYSDSTTYAYSWLTVRQGWHQYSRETVLEHSPMAICISIVNRETITTINDELQAVQLADRDASGQVIDPSFPVY